MKELSFSTAPTWMHLPPGLRVTLLLVHGDADSVTAHPSAFPATEEGRQDAQALITALEHWSHAPSQLSEGCTEDLCAWISRQTGLEEHKLFELMEPLVISDCTDDERMAEPAAYVVEAVDAEGKAHKAHFACPRSGKHVGYFSLRAQLDPTYLREWA